MIITNENEIAKVFKSFGLHEFQTKHGIKTSLLTRDEYRQLFPEAFRESL